MHRFIDIQIALHPIVDTSKVQLLHLFVHHKRDNFYASKIQPSVRFIALSQINNCLSGIFGVTLQS